MTTTTTTRTHLTLSKKDDEEEDEEEDEEDEEEDEEEKKEDDDKKDENFTAKQPSLCNEQSPEPKKQPLQKKVLKKREKKEEEEEEEGDDDGDSDGDSDEHIEETKVVWTICFILVISFLLFTLEIKTTIKTVAKKEGVLNCKINKRYYFSTKSSPIVFFFLTLFPSTINSSSFLTSFTSNSRCFIFFSFSSC